MKNKLVLAGLLALPCAAMAQTAINIYGVIDLFAGRNATASAPQSTPVLTSGGMITSYYGFGGSESLGNGLKANFALEGFYRADTGEAGRFPNEAMFARAANVGFSGDFGLVRMGRVVNPLFVAVGQINPFGPSTRLSPMINQMFTVAGGNATFGDTGWSNAIGYTSPTIHDTTVVAQYSLGETPGQTNNNWAAVAKYAGPTLAVTLGAQNVKTGTGITAAGPSQKTWLAAASYDFKAIKLFASYSHHDTDISNRTGRITHGGFTVPTYQGLGRWMFAVSRLEETASGRADFHRDTGAIGYDHNLSLRTDLYTVFMRDKLSTGSNGNTFVAGIRHRY
ncbi:porin [Pseudoduganella sp. UC29_106]|uniref:porin n=1 Tax=Pseudoduganella sp. UC29_106 TaxID=3374553 RepID=UPI0037570CCE